MFVAIPVPDAVGRTLTARLRRLPRDVVEGLRATPPDTLHLTLRFLGHVPRSLVPDLCSVISAAAVPALPFELRLGSLQWLGNGRSGVLAAGVLSDGSLGELHDRLEVGLERLGFEPERRPFRPHLTLARARGRREGDRRHLAAVADAFLGLSWPADAMILFESHLEAAGARHEPLGVARFRGGPVAAEADGRIAGTPGQRPTARSRGMQSTCRSPSEHASSPPSDSST
ncbi:MAG TPA: RNA 2',3'-cyclic phosphodiesterase [Candidatus Limnocylindrales bacterium]|nr:RNA 2',3'-cyclic phosphodiesterase [Candidatus Limnocylindrales bacterium]